ncbi:MAG TPA: iron-containing alcohol dehydrogenase [Chloroflexota bacterium]|nr:iron-containing alcohol dehydrogenase [Chloroflexota bacterium]
MSPLTDQRFTIGVEGRALFGAGSIAELPSLLPPISGNRVLLVTDGGVVAAGIAGEVIALLEAHGFETPLFDGVHPNPSTATLERGAAAARWLAPSAVIALGGGSVLDAAKGIALLATNDVSPPEIDYRIEPAAPGLPVIAIPTTAGTGSETNGFGVFEDPEAHRKFYAGHASVVPARIILDPVLTLGLPPPATASTGIDVLAHALESLSSRRSNPYAQGLNLQVVRMVLRYLPEAVRDGADLEARAQMLLAAHMAGLAFATTGLGLAHATAHALSAHSGTAHGVGLGILLPHVLAFNLGVCRDAYEAVAATVAATGLPLTSTSEPHAAVEAAHALVRAVGAPLALAEVGVASASIDLVVADALADEVILNTPRLPTSDELRALLEAAF